MYWILAMAVILPLVLTGPRCRTWVALAGAFVLSTLWPDVRWYIAVDLICGTIVLLHPVGMAQRMIGMIFAAMTLFSVGYLVGGEQSPGLYTQWQHILGWAQWAILAVWGGYDVFWHHLVNMWHHWHVPALRRRNP